MKKRAFNLILILFCIIGAKAANKEFTAYAQNQAQLMHNAYNKRDTKAYGEALDAFKAKYDKLSPQDQKDYLGFMVDGYYNFSCTYSLLNNHKPAIDYLEKTLKIGYINIKHIDEDSDLDNIRNDAAFIALVRPLREVYDYLYIIKKAKAYNTAETRILPAFTYQSADNPNLVILRKTFNLDSVAGKGDEVSKAINLMYWIHNLVPHDGQNGNPTVKNALSMITVCKQEKRGLNCRGLATVLNECYLSMGFKSRFVTCLPKDSLHIDNDCHVINMVYINSLKKWVWMDPTNCAYVMDEKGQLLGLEEVRERLTSGKPLIINPDANWNHRESEYKENYLYRYMAKNLYLLECPVSSEYDTETRADGKIINYIQLLPLDYFKQTPITSSSTGKKDHTTITTYLTNNPTVFWAPPAGK